jgi:hypothetical protein
MPVKMVEIPIGGYLVVHASSGRWFPATADEQLDASRPLLARTIKPLRFDANVGIDGRTVEREDLKRYFADRGVVDVYVPPPPKPKPQMSGLNGFFDPSELKVVDEALPPPPGHSPVPTPKPKPKGKRSIDDLYESNGRW